MRLNSVQLDNFRGFERLRLPLHPSVNVLVGVNGAGKTSVLEGISSALECVTREVGRRVRGGMPSDIFLADPDVRSGAAAARVTISSTWRRRRPAWFVGWPDPTWGGDAIELAEALSNEAQKPQARLPILAYYGTERGTGPIGEEEPDDEKPAWAYVESQNAWAAFGHFTNWFRMREDIENERIRDDRAHVDLGLENVRKALERFLPGFEKPRFRRTKSSTNTGIVVTKGGVTLNLRQLSHGERISIALVGDIARRMVIGNPGAEMPLLGEGVVLIDEPELHLHPGWQRTVIPRLRQTFPNLQWILATHSPQVVSSVGPESLVVLEAFGARSGVKTEGRDANAILADVMGVERFGPSVRKQLQAIDRQIDTGDLAEARRLVAALARQFGADDPEVVRLGSLISTLAE